MEIKKDIRIIEVEKVTYIASDGKEFNELKDCKEYEIGKIMQYEE